MNVVHLPVRQNIDALWQRYQRLASAAIEQPRLMADRQHCEAMAKAHKDWHDAFLGGHQ